MKLAAGIEYDGTAYCGWQSQPHASNVQDVVEQAISSVADHRIDIVCAGRTDTGVHALGQVVHFTSNASRSERSWLLGINSNLPPDVSITWIREVDEEFHARFSAHSRIYRYIILNQWLRPALSRHRSVWIKEKLDLGAMQAAASCLVGKHDFSSFRSSACQANSPIREVKKLAVTQNGDYFYLDIEADAFLHHMVRNIAGSLIRVGAGLEDPSWVSEVLAKHDRSAGGITAPAEGLYFIGVEYPDVFSLPPIPALPGLLG